MAIYFGLLLLITIIAPLYGSTLITTDPPDPSKAALMGRYIIHKSDWVAVATTSTMKQIQAYPFVNIQSMSDGPVSNGTGVPYLYLTPKDQTVIDAELNNHCTIIATMAESDYCKYKNYDPEDPRCARVFLTGKLVKVDEKTDEYKFAQNAVFSRHPPMRHWPNDHNWFFAKIEIEMVQVQDNFGGVIDVSVEDYFAANLNTDDNLLLLLKIFEVLT